MAAEDVAARATDDGPPGQGLAVVAAEGPAARAGLSPGDCLRVVNGIAPEDVLDLELAAADGALWLTVVRGGRSLELAVLPRPGEWHGITLAHGLGTPPRHCRCSCRFCFVDQLPDGLRRGLYAKEDDYRLSFLHGEFTTLAGVDDRDLDRIVRLRLTPLYVSLHAWDDEVRVRLMGRAAAGSRRSLQRLAAARVELHLQVVLCPDWNDGEVLEETVRRCAALDGVADVGIVPVSLAVEGDLRRAGRGDAARVIASVRRWQKEFRASKGRCFVHAADELHLLGGAEPPVSDAPLQYQNGIGMVAELLAEAQALARDHRGGPRLTLRLLCGELATDVVTSAATRLVTAGVRAAAWPVRNQLFGRHVTVTGLLGGAEVLQALEADPLSHDEWLVAPRDWLPAATRRTLDDVSEDELARACQGRLALGHGLAEAFATLPE